MGLIICCLRTRGECYGATRAIGRLKEGSMKKNVDVGLQLSFISNCLKP